ncbi:uncharacterized protein LOC132204694 [Neocloeon triangulifer]|uniref:uncharacterized protein LOC132204694 n=1 Tax=Neocloeon triangulifer TaxID=2078957 RepID=UPI00286F5BA7|nr:uncharacterized protein LOC132204694 [Neocloeon triangulifer]XP_059489328.1 uncharacterized protein LOC132204694 [Neocloeon triangulifer]
MASPEEKVEKPKNHSPHAVNEPCLAARMPWLSLRRPQNLPKITDMAYFQDQISLLYENTEDSNKEFNIFLYRLWTLSMPYILPDMWQLYSSYCSFLEARLPEVNPEAKMRCALYYFWTTQAHGKEFVNAVTEAVDPKLAMQSNILEYLHKVRQGVSPLTDQCATLPNSIVNLLQILYNPVLLHQWLLVVTEQYFRIYSQLIVPPVLESVPLGVKQMTESHNALMAEFKCHISSLFEHLETIRKSSWERKKPKEVSRICAEIFDTHVVKILFYIKFYGRNQLVSKRLTDLKNKVLHNKMYTDTLLFSETLMQQHDTSFEHGFKFFNGNSFTSRFTFSTPDLPPLFASDDAPRRPPSSDVMLRYFTPDYVEKPWLKWFPTETEFNEAHFDIIYLRGPHFKQLVDELDMQYEMTTELCEQDYGMLHSAMIARYEMRKSEVEAILKTLFWAELTRVLEPKINRPSTFLNFPTDDSRTAILNLCYQDLADEHAQYQEFFETACLKSTVRCLEGVLIPRPREAKSFCSLRKRKSGWMELNDMIDTIVVELMRMQHGLEKEVKYTPEFPVVKYILPWFVSSHFYVYRANEEWRNLHTIHERYMRFVYDLITSYSPSKCVFTLTSLQTFPSILSLISQNSNVTFVEILKWKLKCIESEYKRLFYKEEKLPILESHFLEQLKIFIVFDSCLDFKGKDKMWENNFALSSRSSYRYLSKVAYALKFSADWLECMEYEDTVKVNQLRQESLWFFVNLIYSLSNTKKKQISAMIAVCIDHLKFKMKETDMESCISTNVPELLVEIQSLKFKQIAGLVTYLIISNVNEHKKSKKRSEFSCLEPLDDLERALFGILRNDHWETKQVLSQLWFNDDSDRQDLSLVTFEFAKSTAPILYAHALANVNPKSCLKMTKPGEITFCPIKHCRWCGKVDVQEFRICEECLCNEEYPDVNLFCSDICEDSAMKKRHRDEHERFLFSKCDI